MKIGNRDEIIWNYYEHVPTVSHWKGFNYLPSTSILLKLHLCIFAVWPNCCQLRISWPRLPGGPFAGREGPSWNGKVNGEAKVEKIKPNGINMGLVIGLGWWFGFLYIILYSFDQRKSVNFFFCRWIHPYLSQKLKLIMRLCFISNQGKIWDIYVLQFVASTCRQGQAVLQRTTAERNYRNTMDAAAGSPKGVVLGSLNGTHFGGNQTIQIYMLC